MKRFFQPVAKEGSFKKLAVSAAAPPPDEAEDSGAAGPASAALDSEGGNRDRLLLRPKNEDVDPDVICFQEVKMPAAGSNGAPKNPSELKEKQMGIGISPGGDAPVAAAVPARRRRARDRAQPVDHRRRGHPERDPDQGLMRVRTSWTLVVAAYRGLPSFQMARLEAMGFEPFLRIEPISLDLPLIQAIRERWDPVSRTFLMSWGHMVPSLEDVARITGLHVHGEAVTGYTYPDYSGMAERLLGVPVMGAREQSRTVSRLELMKRFGLQTVRQLRTETQEQFLTRAAALARATYTEDETDRERIDVELRRFLFLLFGRLIFATKGDGIQCRFLGLLEDLSAVGSYAWGAAMLAHMFADLTYYSGGRETTVTGFASFLQLWSYYYFPMGRALETRPTPVPLARRWIPVVPVASLNTQLRVVRRDLSDFPALLVVWRPYGGMGDEGQQWVVDGRVVFGRDIWLHCLNDIEPLRLRLVRTLGFHQDWVEVAAPERVGRKTRGKAKVSDWRVRAEREYQDWHRCGELVLAVPGLESSHAYLERYRRVFGHRDHVRPLGDPRDGAIETLRAQLATTEAQLVEVREALVTLRAEQEAVGRATIDGASSSQGPSPDMTALQEQLASALSRAEEAERVLTAQSLELLDVETRISSVQRDVQTRDLQITELQGGMQTRDARIAELECEREEAGDLPRDTAMLQVLLSMERKERERERLERQAERRALERELMETKILLGSTERARAEIDARFRRTRERAVDTGRYSTFSFSGLASSSGRQRSTVGERSRGEPSTASEGSMRPPRVVERCVSEQQALEQPTAGEQQQEVGEQLREGTDES